MIELLHEIEARKGVPVELLCAALEEAVNAAYREHAGDVDAVATVDRRTATIAIHRRRTVVVDVADPEREIAADGAPIGYLPGDFVDEPVELGSFGRIAALTAKRVIAQRVLEHERERVFQHYRALQGTVVRGLVQRELHGSLYVVFDDGNEALLPKHERAPRDRFAINDTVEAELFGVYKTTRGPALLLSRSRASFVRALFDRPEILAAARRPGFVTTLASTRPLPAELVAEIRAKLAGERIEVIRWSADRADMVVQLLPIGAGEAFTLEDERIVIVEGADVTDLQLELASELCGWPVIAAAPGKSDVALEAHRAAIAAATPAPCDVEIDPELVRKLEEFVRERVAEEN